MDRCRLGTEGFDAGGSTVPGGRWGASGLQGSPGRGRNSGDEVSDGLGTGGPGGFPPPGWRIPYGSRAFSRRLDSGAWQVTWASPSGRALWSCLGWLGPCRDSFGPPSLPHPKRWRPLGIQFPNWMRTASQLSSHQLNLPDGGSAEATESDQAHQVQEPPLKSWRVLPSPPG